MEVRICSDGQNRAVARPYTLEELGQLLSEHSTEVDRGYSTPCLEWTRSSATPGGYGIIRYQKKSHTAQRIAWLVNFGEIPPGLFALHHCDNRLCIRADHLFLGTQQDNVDDMVSKARNIRGERSHWSRLTEADIPIIRERSKTEHRHLIAHDYGVSRTTIDAIVNRLTWKHIHP